MNLTATIEARRFPVTVRTYDAGTVTHDFIVLTKDQLRAAGLIGKSSKEIIAWAYSGIGEVLDIGKPERRSIRMDMDELWKLHSREVQRDTI